MFNTGLFTMYKLFTDGGGRFESVEEAALAADSISGAQQKRAMWAHLTKEDEAAYAVDPKAAVRAATIRIFAKNEKLDLETAAEIFDSVPETAPAVPQPVNDMNVAVTTPTLADDVAVAYYRIERAAFVAAMQLNVSDYEAVFPTRACAHDPRHIIKILRNPNHRLTDAERNEHFSTRRAEAFAILNSMSQYEIYATIEIPDLRTLQSAGRYQTLRAAFDDAVEVAAAEQKAAEDAEKAVETRAALKDGIIE